MDERVDGVEHVGGARLVNGRRQDRGEDGPGVRRADGPPQRGVPLGRGRLRRLEGERETDGIHGRSA